jgi:hypothetical protein
MTYSICENYLVDVGYPNRFGYLAPYKGERDIKSWSSIEV